MTSCGESAAGSLWIGVEPHESETSFLVEFKEIGGSHGCPCGVTL